MTRSIKNCFPICWKAGILVK